MNASFSKHWLFCTLPLAALAAGYVTGHAPPEPASAQRITPQPAVAEKLAGLANGP